MRKRLLLYSLLPVLLILCSLRVNLFSAQAEASGSTLPTVHVGDGVYYGVALGSYPVWRHNDGRWQNGHEPDGPFTITHPYTFTFPGWTVVDYEVSPFASDGSPVSIPDLPAGMTPESMFEQLRGYSWDNVQRVVGSNYTVSSTDIPVSDPSTISFNLTTSGVLTAERPIPLHLNPDGSRREDLLPNVVGFEYYFPVLIRLELIREGKAYIRHYTTDGKSLSGVFNDRDETLNHGQTYNFTNPTDPAYRYIGYKVGIDSPPESGSNWNSGSGPGPFNYDSSQFSKYYVTFYYEPDTTPDKPDLVAVDIAPNGPIEVGKPASFTAKWRVDHQATGKPYNVKIMVDGGELKLVSQPAGGPGNYSTDFTYTFTSTAQKTFLLAVDSANAIAETNENNNQVSKSFKPGSATPEPEDPPANACTVPPVARITAPSTKMAGELVEISGAESEASAPAAITEYRWQLEGTDSTITGTGGYAVYMMPGSYTIALQVTDSNGCTGTATWRIAIEAPVPTAFPDYAGTLKENRKVTLDGTRSFSPPGYPIISYEWSIRPVSGGSASAVKYSGALSGSRKDILVKQAGTYIVELTVTNSYGLSASASLPMTIVPDEPPVAVFTVVKEVLRDPARGMKAPLKARDASYSPDGDMIAQRIWSYRYDSDNDGDFDDEAVVIIDSGNKTEIEHLVPDVGRYRIYLEVVEDFGQPTIQQFIASGDYRRGQSWR